MYQVVLSIFTGIKGVAIAAHYVVDRIPDWREEWWRLGKNGPHFVLLLALTFFGLAYVAAAAEDNSSWFFSIPNEEFTRVLGDICLQRGGAAPRRRGPNGASYAPPDSLSPLTARMRESGRRGRWRWRAIVGGNVLLFCGATVRFAFDDTRRRRVKNPAETTRRVSYPHRTREPHSARTARLERGGYTARRLARGFGPR